MIVNADARHIPIADNTVQCVVTSPPYYGLRDYGTARWEGGDPNCDHLQVNDTRDPKITKQTQNAGTSKLGYKSVCAKCGAVRIDSQIGLEETPEQYVANMVAVFREVRRVLRPDGTLWLNIGDSYAVSGSRTTGRNDAGRGGQDGFQGGQGYGDAGGRTSAGGSGDAKPKDLIGIPWMVAFALRADGWYLRRDIIWYKPNPMPESVKDRPTTSHEYVFLLTKSPTYYYDYKAILEPAAYDGRLDTKFKGSTKYKDSTQTFTKQGHERWTEKIYPEGENQTLQKTGHSGYMTDDGKELLYRDEEGVPARNKRSVWTIVTQPTSFAHFATFPEKLVEPCILAGTSEKGCCPKCGAPYERIVEAVGGTIGRAWNDHQDDLEQGQRAERAAKGGHGYHRIERGWKPGCKCNAGNPVPCIVFDPFSGSGTVERVAIKYSRRAIGTELKFDYIDEIAKRRTSEVQMHLIEGGEE